MSELTELILWVSELDALAALALEISPQGALWGDFKGKLHCNGEGYPHHTLSPDLLETKQTYDLTRLMTPEGSADLGAIHTVYVVRCFK